MESEDYFGYVDRWDDQQVLGWAWGRECPDNKPHVFLLADGKIVDCVLPHVYRPDIQATHGGDGVNGYVLNIPAGIRRSARRLEVLFENGQSLTGGAITLRRWTFPHRRPKVPVHCALRDPGLIFLHIQKTAGTSVRRVFDNHFGQERIFYLYPTPPGMTRQHLMRIPMSQRAQVPCVFGHEYYGVHGVLPGIWRYATVLRDPVARVVSNYYHHQNATNGALPPLIDAVANPSLIELDNFMVRSLAGVDADAVPLGSVDEGVFNLALENAARHFSFIGFVEDGVEFARGLARLLGRPSVDIPIDNVGVYDRNVGAANEDVAVIQDRNRFDVMLYDILRSKRTST